MKLAMINVERTLREEQFGTRMILTVHDELVFEVIPAEKKAATDLVKRAMTDVIDMKVPLAVDLSFGENWAAAKG
jgi:DNA polymerase I